MNIDERKSKFQAMLKNEHVFRIPLPYFTDLSKKISQQKLNIELSYILKQKLFESRKVLASGTVIPAPDAKIIFTRVPFIQYEQILLDKNFRQCLETIMVFKKILRVGAQKTPILKT